MRNFGKLCVLSKSKKNVLHRMGTLAKRETVSLISLRVLRVVRTHLNPRMLSLRGATLAENLRNFEFDKIPHLRIRDSDGSVRL